MNIPSNNDPQDIFDTQFTILCPHCLTRTSITAISIPRFELVRRFKLKEVGIAYRCNACNRSISLRFFNVNADANPITVPASFVELERPEETFEYKYLPPAVADDLREALTCYSQSCFNAFAAMCRRCIQSVAEVLGAEGTTKVEGQLKDLKGMGVIDEEAFDQLKQIMLTGHDGAHPHLPKLSPERAGVLLELMKDVLYQLFVRQAKIREAAELRRQSASGRT